MHIRKIVSIPVQVPKAQPIDKKEKRFAKKHKTQNHEMTKLQ